MRQIVELASRPGLAPAAAALALTLAGCATAPAAAPPGGSPAAQVAPPARHDPLERVNRGLFGLGDALDRGIIHPIVVGYRRIAPAPVRRAIHNVLQNLDEPVVFVNDVLQVHPKTAAKTVVRFAVNSTVGVAGIFDAASTAGLPHHDNGFGSTLGRYGVGPGPFIYVPLLGPTTLRDAIGQGVDFAADPLTWSRFANASQWGLTRTGLDLLDQREQAEDQLRALRETTVDPYASLRSSYLQSREAEIRGSEAPLEPLPDMPEAAPTAPQGETPPSASSPPPAVNPPPEP